MGTAQKKWRASFKALTNATFPYALEIANKGWVNALLENPEIKLMANLIDGSITYQGVTEALDLKYVPIDVLLKDKQPRFRHKTIPNSDF